jgi:hypothetical protein
VLTCPVCPVAVVVFVLLWLLVSADCFGAVVPPIAITDATTATTNRPAIGARSCGLVSFVNRLPASWRGAAE